MILQGAVYIQAVSVQMLIKKGNIHSGTRNNNNNRQLGNWGTLLHPAEHNRNQTRLRKPCFLVPDCGITLTFSQIQALMLPWFLLNLCVDKVQKKKKRLSSNGKGKKTRDRKKTEAKDESIDGYKKCGDVVIYVCRVRDLYFIFI